MATALRQSFRRAPGTEAPDWSAAVRSSATPLRALGLVIGALVLAAWPDPTDRVYITTFVLLALYLIGLWLITSDSEWATNGRQRLSSLTAASADQNDTLVGRHAGQLRIAGILLAGVAIVFVPNLGLGALAGIVALTLAYLAVVEWLSTRTA